MKLYLVQHGASLSKDIDPECALSNEGTESVNQLGEYLSKCNINVPHVYHSAKKRARQTAEILSSFLSDGKCEELDGLKPMDPVEPIVKIIPQFTEDTMLVGHLPFMGKIVSALVGQDQDTSTVQFIPGSIACLEKNEHGKWEIIFFIRPDSCR